MYEGTVCLLLKQKTIPRALPVDLRHGHDSDTRDSQLPAVDRGRHDGQPRVSRGCLWKQQQIESLTTPPWGYRADSSTLVGAVLVSCFNACMVLAHSSVLVAYYSCEALSLDGN